MFPRTFFLFITIKGILTTKIKETITFYVCLNHWRFIKICDNSKKNGSIFFYCLIFFIPYCNWNV